jgi:hypothetical protein
MVFPFEGEISFAGINLSLAVVTFASGNASTAPFAGTCLR